MRRDAISLQGLHTFGTATTAEAVVPIRSLAELEAWQARHDPSQPYLILGGGSNVLFATPHYPGTILHNQLMGRRVVVENEREVIWELGAGEAWHDCVLEAVAQGWGGIENLALIPGTVGAAPMQNIGAYGVELQSAFHSLRAYHLSGRAVQDFSAADCAFGYRSSIFKTSQKGAYFILSVQLRLSKAPHVLHTTYGALQAELGPGPHDIRQVAEAVMRIRRSKLPDPAVLGNAGSFFKNPVVDADTYSRLAAEYPDMPAYPAADGVKLAAGWLIEACGWKGKQEGNTGAHARQALVLVNYGGATGSEVWQLAQDIQASVASRFGLQLEPEVNIIQQ